MYLQTGCFQLGILEGNGLGCRRVGTRLNLVRGLIAIDGGSRETIFGTDESGMDIVGLDGFECVDVNVFDGNVTVFGDVQLIRIGDGGACFGEGAGGLSGDGRNGIALGGQLGKR